MAGNAVETTGHKVTITGATDIKVTDTSTMSLTATLNQLSNGVAVGEQVIEGRRTSTDATKAKLNQFYYTVTKNNEEITSGLTLSTTGTAINIPLVTTTSENGLTVIDKTNGAGVYQVVIWKAIGDGESATPSAFTRAASATYNVKDTQDEKGGLVFIGKKASSISKDKSDADIIKDCFKFTLNGSEIKDYTDIKVVPSINQVTNGTVAYVNSVTMYVKTASGAYLKYTVNVGDYVNLQ